MATPERERVRVAAVQNDPKLGAVEANRRDVLTQLDAAADGGADVVVFPECSITGYVFDSRAEAAALAEPPDGPSVRAIEGVCARRGVSAIVGMLIAEGDRLYNACVMISPKGLKSVYRKTHLPFMGLDRFVDAGDALPEVVDLDGVRVATLVCYDGAFPEPSRALALAGAELIVLPTNWPEGAESQAEHLMACRAMENVVYSVAASRVGTERGCRFIGGSGIYDPYGRTLVKTDDSSITTIAANIDPALARTKRIIRKAGEREIDRIHDRRPELYGSLVEPVNRANRR